MKKLYSMVALCTSLLIALSVTAQCDKPVIISDAATVCTGGQTTLHTNNVAGATYSWSDGASTAVRPASAGTYTVTITYSGGCTQTSDPVVVTEKTFPAVIPGDTTKLCSGQSLQLYADTGNIWVRKKDISAAAVRTQGIGFSIGSKGYIGAGTNGSLLSDFWEYDEATDVWTQKADIPGGGRNYATGFSLNYKGYAGLGNSTSGLHNDWYEYDPYANTWTAKASYPGGGTTGAVGFAINSAGLGYVGLGQISSGAFPLTFYAYNPATDQWTSIAAFPGTGRREPVGFSVSNKGYVATGWLNGGANANDCWQYDPTSNAWSTAPSLPGDVRRTSTAFTIQDHAYVTCGYATTLGVTNELWEFYNNAWTKRADFGGAKQYGPMSFGLHDKGIVCLGSAGNKEVWVYYPKNTVTWPGGSTQVSHTVNTPGSYSAVVTDIEGCAITTTPLTITSNSVVARITSSGSTTICDGTADTLYANGDVWTQKNNFPSSGTYSTGFSVGTAGYYCGGNAHPYQFWKYDASTDTWSQQADLPVYTIQAPAVAWNGKGWMLGSSDKTMWMYDPAYNTWVKKATSPGNAQYIVQGFLVNNQFVVPGGLNAASAPLTEVYSYDLVHDTWTRKNDLPYSMSFAPAFALNGKGYLCTGNSTRDGAANPQSAVCLQYDPTADSWTAMPDFPGGARGGGIAWTDGHNKAYVGMGNHGPLLTDVWQLDATTLTWTRMTDIPVGRYGAIAFTLGHYAYIATGATPAGQPDVWQYEMPYNYTWSTGATTRYIKVTTAGDYSVTVANDDGCTATSSPVHITVQPKTIVGTSPADVTVCDQTATGFSVTATGLNVTYRWQVNGSDVANGGVYSGAGTNALAISNVNGLGANQYRCIVAGTCGIDTTVAATLHVNLLPVMPVITAGSATTFCDGGSVLLTSSATSGNAWSNGATTQSISVNTSGTFSVKNTDANGCVSPVSIPVSVTVNTNPSKPVITAGGTTTFCNGGSVTLSSSAASGNAWSNGATTQSTPVTTTGSYTVRVTDGNGCVSPVSDAVAVTVNATPTKPVITAGSATTFCDGGSVTLTSSATSGNAWSNGTTAQSTPVTTTGSYTVQVTDGNGCVSPVSDAVVVTVNANPSKPIIAANGATTFCEGGSVTLSSSATSGNAWSNGATTQSTPVTTTGSYTVRVTDANGCISPTSDAIAITVNALPAQPTISTIGSTAFCAGGSATLRSSSGTNNHWSNGSTSQQIIVNQGGTYTLQVIDNNGCQSPLSNAVTITENPLPAQPVITASGPTTFCDGNSVTLTASAANAWRWNTGSSRQSISVSSSGSYYVTVTDANGCTSPASNSVTVKSNPLPAGNITVAGPMLSGNTHYMQLTAPYTAGAQYAWSTGDNSEVLQATRSGSYSVVVTSDQGCRQVFQTTVQLIDLTQIPNTFSPNHDGINDYWMVKALDAFPNATAQVFNRSGVKVWEARSPGVRWDGTSGGRELPAGVYFYVLDLKDGSAPVNGWINLLR